MLRLDTLLGNVILEGMVEHPCQSPLSISVAISYHINVTTPFAM
jgi:hypothetical protein